MVMSGTSIAAPALSGAVALMLEANPGLTPPLIKAMLQYSAQPLPNANLLQQGAGPLNVDGSAMLGASSSIGKTGVFIPTATLSGWFVARSGVVMSEGLVFGEK